MGPLSQLCDFLSLGHPWMSKKEHIFVSFHRPAIRILRRLGGDRKNPKSHDLRQMWYDHRQSSNFLQTKERTRSGTEKSEGKKSSQRRCTRHSRSRSERNVVVDYCCRSSDRRTGNRMANDDVIKNWAALPGVETVACPADSRQTIGNAGGTAT